MMNQISRAGIFGAMMLLIFCTATALRAQEQTTFGAEDAIKSPAKIPIEIMTQLKRDNRVKQCVAEKGAVKSNWFSAAKVDLNGDQVTDYVVKAENSCLFGANLAPFWIFHNLTTRYSLVLRADTLGLEILPETTEDYHNIKLSRATAIEVSENILKFDGAKYR
ncbi:MAG: hypothetical protein ABI954_06095 [Pyrinomonadaceae bacterium]